MFNVLGLPGGELYCETEARKRKIRSEVHQQPERRF